MIYIPYPRVNCLKTIPFTAAHTYIAHIWQCPPPGLKESVAFKFTKKQISVGRSHTRAHSRAVFLKIVFGIKCEVTHGKDYSNEVANSFRRDMFISAFLKEKTTVT